VIFILLIYNKKCEFNPFYEIFPRNIDGFPYPKIHHLIPLKYSNLSDISIDVPKNIVCLFSTCHNYIHYGQNNRKIHLVQFGKKDNH